MHTIFHRVTRRCLIMISIMTGTLAYAQPNIGGIINDYAVVQEVISCDSAVVVDDASAFSAGDRVLLAQMKGATIVGANDSTYGTLVDLNAAGGAEFLVIERIDGTRITFTSRMVHPFDPASVVQLVRVPTYASARVSSTLTARPWDGATGGILALWVEGTLFLDSAVDVSAMGYRGGRRGGRSNGCNMTDYVTNFGEQRAGGKGEGPVLTGLIAARGRLLSGGGGGNGHNSGGAGGGNGGEGGHGGDASVYCREAMNVGGVGGSSLAPYVREQRFFMGSGGGGAHENRGDFEGTDGGHGGGLVMIHARVIDTRIGLIASRGANVSTISGWDGAGGGGAGGTVFIEAESIVGLLRIDVRGGKGGDIGLSGSQGKVYSAHGPGGGGAGGMIVTTRAHAAIVPELRGGIPGIHIEPNNEAYMQSRNAAVGGTGVIIDDLTWRSPKAYPFAAGGGGAICPGDTITLTAMSGFLRYLWSNGATTQDVRVTEEGTYSVTAIDSGGCPHVVTDIVVRYNPARYTVDRNIDFGACDLLRAYDRTHTFTNVDDDPIVISNIDVPIGFTVLWPTVFPITVDPGTSIDIAVRFFATEDKAYGGIMAIDVVGPCPTLIDVKVSALVKPVYITFIMPDTVARIGQRGFGIPVTAAMTPDSAVFNDVTFTLDVSMDSRLFAPDSVSRGTIVRNIIDVIRRTRTLTIRFDSLDFSPGTTLLTHVYGTVLSAAVFATPLTMPEYLWIEARQQPVTTVDEGSLIVDPTCFAEGRPILLFGMPTMFVAPNPATEVATITVTTTVPGPHMVDIIDARGRVLRSVPIIPTTEPVTLRLGDLDDGVYYIRYTTPVNVLSTMLVVQ